MSTLIFDLETDGLDYTRIWCMPISDMEGNVKTYADQLGYPSLAEGVERLAQADRVVAHNAWGFDYPALERFFPGAIHYHQVWDTLIASRLESPDREGGHSLRNWGDTLGYEKFESPDFFSFTPSMVEYAERDVLLGLAVYKKLEPVVSQWEDAMHRENLVAHIISLQERNGFTLDVEKAQDLECELRVEQKEIEGRLQDIFHPIIVQDGKESVVPKRTQNRTRKDYGYTEGITKDCPYSKVKVQVFNPASRQQVADRLITKYDWKPDLFTPSGAPQVDEQVLKALPYPEAQEFSRYLRVGKQLGQLVDGKNGWLKLVKPTGRVHGRVRTIGAATSRMSHSEPNLAQVDKKDKRMREVWIPRDGWKLVGSDAEGLELRMLAHYITRYDNGAMIKMVTEGNKEDGTDPHTINQHAIGLPKRDGAKRVLYGTMYGASDHKLGEIIRDECSMAGQTLTGTNASIGAKGRKGLARGLVGIDKVTELVQFKAKKDGYITGLDGRKVYIRSPHSALNFLLQSAGAIVMKEALVVFHFELVQWECDVDFAYCANVHDEVQIECRPEIAEDIGRTFAKAIEVAGEKLGVRCPLAGSYDIGDSWKETH